MIWGQKYKWREEPETQYRWNTFDGGVKVAFDDINRAFNDRSPSFDDQIIELTEADGPYKLR